MSVGMCRSLKDLLFSATCGVEIGDEQEAVSADMLIDSPAEIPHRLFNESDGDFRLLVVKTPRPTRATKVL